LFKIMLLLIVLAILFTAVAPAYASDSICVYYAGSDGTVRTALELANFQFVNDSAQADFFVLNGSIRSWPRSQPRCRAGRGWY